MTTGLMARPEANVKAEMKAHRERLKQAVHPGLTRKEAGFTPEQWELLSAGVCDGLAGATVRGERLANRLLVGLVLVLLLALGVGAVQGRWAERASGQGVQTVEQVMEMGR